jgi:1-phosphofructokinase
MMMSERPIVTLTLNPALDLTLQLDTLTPGEVNLTSNAHLRVAGKGINVAMLLRDLGDAVCVTGLLGKANRASFDELFAQREMKNRFVYTPGSTRINVKLSERGSRVTDINTPGLDIPTERLSLLREQLRLLAAETEYFVLSGSLPGGVPATLYGELTRQLQSSGSSHRVLLDTSGQALKAAIESAPFLVKPNVEELSQWAGRPLTGREEQEAVICDWLSKGVEHVVLSDGPRGVRWYTRDRAIEATPPSVQVVSTVGAGDSLVAGLAHGLAAGMDMETTIARATALSALAVTQVGVGITSKAELKKIQQQVTVKPLPFRFEVSS